MLNVCDYNLSAVECSIEKLNTPAKTPRRFTVTE